MSVCSDDTRAFYESLADEMKEVGWYKVIVERLVKECLMADGALSSIYPPQKGTAVYSEWDDLVPTLLLFGHYDFLLDQIPVSQKYLFDGLPTKQGRLVYSWRVDEFLAGLVEINRYIPSDAVSDQISRSLTGVQSKLLSHDGTIRGIYDPVDAYSPDVFYARAGGLVEVLLNRDDFEDEMAKLALRALDWWLENPFFRRYGLFPCKWFPRNSLVEIWASSGLFVPTTDGRFQKSGNSYIEKGRLRDYRRLLWKPSSRVQLMKDNSNLVFAFMEGWRRTRDCRYSEAITLWCNNVLEKMRFGPFICATWHPKAGPSDPRLSQNFTFIDILCDSYIFIHPDPGLLKTACKLAQAWVDLRWDIGLVPSRPGGKVATLDEQTDFVVSLIRLSELSGNGRWRKTAGDIIASAKEAFLGPTGLVVSVGSDGSWVDDRVATKYNLLFAKALAATLTQKRIFDTPMLYDFLKDR
jgi:hypothetical protein